MELRKYQNDVINNVSVDCKKGLRNICVVLPCGGGKTVVMSEIIKRANKKGNKVLFLVHRRELIKQAKDTFEAVGISMQVIEGKIDIESARTCLELKPRETSYENQSDNLETDNGEA